MYILLSCCYPQDTDGDGYLSFEELRQGLDAASGNSVQCSEAAKAVMQALDVSGDGSIEYHEFLAAVVDRQRTLTDQTLAEMFGEAMPKCKIWIYKV